VGHVVSRELPLFYMIITHDRVNTSNRNRGVDPVPDDPSCSLSGIVQLNVILRTSGLFPPVCRDSLVDPGNQHCFKLVDHELAL